jgi:hypothetical protein
MACSFRLEELRLGQACSVAARRPHVLPMVSPDRRRLLNSSTVVARRP